MYYFNNILPILTLDTLMSILSAVIRSITLDIVFSDVSIVNVLMHWLHQVQHYIYYIKIKNSLNTVL